MAASKRKFVALYDQPGFIQPLWRWGLFDPKVTAAQIRATEKKLKKATCVIDPGAPAYRDSDCFTSKRAAQRWLRQLEENRIEQRAESKRICENIAHRQEAFVYAGKTLDALNRKGAADETLLAGPRELLRREAKLMRERSKMCRQALADARRQARPRLGKWKPRGQPLEDYQAIRKRLGLDKPARKTKTKRKQKGQR